MDSAITKRFMRLFRGYEKAHGEYRVQKKEADGKMSGRAVTVAEPATTEHFEAHPKGSDYILGIIMLRETTHAILELLILTYEAR